MHISFVWPGKTKFPWLKQGIEYYVERLKPYARINVVEVRSRAGVSAPPGKSVAAEAKAILRALPGGACLIGLDQSGQPLDSVGLARLLDRLEQEAQRHVCVVVGGAYGLSADVTGRCRHLVSLSPMTFTHDMARLILAEQLYRAFSIKAGTPYHH